MNASELILNDDGSIYHLGIRTEHCAPFILTVGDPERVPTVSQFFDYIEFRHQKREICIHTGKLGNQSVSVISTGMGTDNIDIILNEIDALFSFDINTGKPLHTHNPLTFIRLGTSGAIQADIGLDSLVVAEGAIGFDNLMHYYDPKMSDHPLAEALHLHMGNPKKINHPYYALGDEGLFATCIDLGMQPGVTATNAGFYAPQGRHLRTQKVVDYDNHHLSQFEYNNSVITNLDMETAGIYGLSRVLGHKAISISAILANRINGTFSENPDKAVHDMIAVVTSSIKEGKL